MLWLLMQVIQMLYSQRWIAILQNQNKRLSIDSRWETLDIFIIVEKSEAGW
jgi:hypothetical protein